MFQSTQPAEILSFRPETSSKRYSHVARHKTEVRIVGENMHKSNTNKGEYSQSVKLTCVFRSQTR